MTGVLSFELLIVMVQLTLTACETKTAVMLTRPMQIGRKTIWGQLVSGKVNPRTMVTMQPSEVKNKTSQFKNLPPDSIESLQTVKVKVNANTFATLQTVKNSKLLPTNQSQRLQPSNRINRNANNSEIESSSKNFIDIDDDSDTFLTVVFLEKSDGNGLVFWAVCVFLFRLLDLFGSLVNFVELDLKSAE